MRSRTAHTRHLAAKPAFVPFWSIVSHERKFGCKDPPFTGKRQIAELHVFQYDIMAPANLGGMFSEASTQCPLAFSGALRRFADVILICFQDETKYDSMDA